MGFGESASHIIFFIAAVMVASSAATVMSITTYKISLNLAEESKHLREAISTDFKIINDPVN
ncbi:flagellar protein G, partial [Archaeoglobales archaeon]